MAGAGFEHAQQAIDRVTLATAGSSRSRFYVIYGYDDTGYYFSWTWLRCGQGSKALQDLGTRASASRDVHVAPGIAADDATTQTSVAFAVHHAASPPGMVYEHYGTGLKVFDNWIRASKRAKPRTWACATTRGSGWSAGACAGFLQEARQRLTGRADELFDRAYTQYATVAAALGKVVELYPWKDDASDEDVLPVDDRSRAAVEALHTAKEAEAAGLVTLERICQVL